MLRSMAGRLITSPALKALRNNESQALFHRLSDRLRVASGEIPRQCNTLGARRLLNSGRSFGSGTDKEGLDLGRHVSWEEAAEAAIKKHKMGIPASMIDIILTDVNKEGLKKVADTMGVKHLVRTSYSPIPFPAAGIIFGANKRLMISLACGYEDRPPVKIIFVVDTGSLHTFVIPSAIDAVLGPKVESTRESLHLKIHSPDRIVEVYVSPQDSHFPDANVLGMAALAKLNLSIEIDYKQDAFRLVANCSDGSDFNQFQSEGSSRVGDEKARGGQSMRGTFIWGTFCGALITGSICTAGLLYLAKGRRDKPEGKSS